MPPVEVEAALLRLDQMQSLALKRVVRVVRVHIQTSQARQFKEQEAAAVEQ
jgi:hypothetical protein